MAVGGAARFGSLTGKASQVYVLDITSNDLVSRFGEHDITNPHDLAVTKDGNTVYTIELNPFRITKFTNGKNGGIKTPKPTSLFSSITSFIFS